MGCKINWIGKRKVKILGVKKLNDVNYKIMPDRIEAGTYLIAAAITKGHLKILGINPQIIKTEIDILKKVGAKIKLKNNHIIIQGQEKIKNINIKTAPYPGFPTDLQAQMMVFIVQS